MSLETRKKMKEIVLAANQAMEDKLATHRTINNFIKKGYYLKIWDDRYGAGIRVALGREYSQVFNEVCELTDSADIEALGLNEYLLNTGAWLPFSCGITIQEALDSLEEKLSELNPEQISRSSYWADQYDLALKAILESADGGYGIASAIDAGKLPLDPSN